MKGTARHLLVLNLQNQSAQSKEPQLTPASVRHLILPSLPPESTRGKAGVASDPCAVDVLPAAYSFKAEERGKRRPDTILV